MAGINPYKGLLKSIKIGLKESQYYDIGSFGTKYDRLPFSIRVLLESAVRNCDNFQVTKTDVEKILDWENNQALQDGVEVAFKPARVILQDFTGVPAVVDFAAMRDAVKRLGGDPDKINPVCPSDLVIDHSIQADFTRSNDALKKNEELEFERNKERFMFLKWGAKAFKNMLIVPPGSGIVHQVNLEYLARVVFDSNNLLYPDSVVGTDSHTTMVNGLGVLGWGVGGIEAEAVMLGQAISMLIPKVVGYKLDGMLNQYATSTDLVLTITKNLRQVGVVGKFVEFFGPGVSQLSIADRATISNMCPEYGATVGFFAVDQQSLAYLKQTGRSEEHIDKIENYLRNVRMLRNYDDPSQDPIFSEVVTLDLSTVVSSVSGPKRPHDRVSVSDMQIDFRNCLVNKVGFKGFGLTPAKVDTVGKFKYEEKEYELKHGSVVIAAITSCTNTSNPSVMLGAGLLAKKAVEAGLSVEPYIKTSLSPGSGVVTYYLQESGVIPYLTKLGFDIVGYGCMTCIGNSGPLPDTIVDTIEKNELICCGVLSGNRNFEGRVHPNTRANYLASPLLVIAYAIAGTVNFDFEKQPLGHKADGTPVFLQDIWPTRTEIHAVEQKYVIPAMFKEVYSKIEHGSGSWASLVAPGGKLYPWDVNSTYIKNPPYFDNLQKELPPIKSVTKARVLVHLGDSVTTDHISPAGSIARNSPAARYLANRGLTPKDFNSYGSRRGNDAVMARGTFANIRLVNKFIGKAGPRTIYIPTNEEMDVFDAAEKYAKDETPLIALVGKEYGSGSSRDWAAKGPYLLGIRAVIAESYERIHRSNLVGMGIVPLQYLPEENAESLGLTGYEQYNITIPKNCQPGEKITVSTDNGKKFEVIARFDTEVDLTYFKHGGFLAKKAVEAGLSVEPYIKTSLSPGSGVVTYYLQESGVIPYLTKLGFDIVGYGCMTCIGNSGPLPDTIVDTIEKNELICCGESGNRNFEGRFHPNTRANYLASPLLVIAYAIAGTVNFDFEKQPLGHKADGTPVFLQDIWPTRTEIHAVEQKYVIPAMFKEVYSKIEHGSGSWASLVAPGGKLYPWDVNSTYIKNPPYFDNLQKELPPIKSVTKARVLVHLGDSVTTDHISPAGSIARNSPAARYLANRGLTPKDFNSYGSRRGNDAVMARGTFANIRLVNKFIGKAGPRTIYIPTNEEMDVFDAAEKYAKDETPLIALVGKEYGSGSSRDWAAKGPYLLGIRAVIAESYERIHRSNLVGMGIVPLQYLPGENAESLGLTGYEQYNITIPKNCQPGEKITVSTDNGKKFEVIARFDTEVDLTYFKHGGILNYMIRTML